jgi:hypothetical protein
MGNSAPMSLKEGTCSTTKTTARLCRARPPSTTRSSFSGPTSAKEGGIPSSSLPKNSTETVMSSSPSSSSGWISVHAATTPISSLLEIGPRLPMCIGADEAERQKRNKGQFRPRVLYKRYSMPMYRIGDKTIYEPSAEAREFSARVSGILARICFLFAAIYAMMKC